MACLLLLVTSVMLASVVAVFAVNISEQSLNPDANPQVGKIQDLNQQLLNQTQSLFDQFPDDYNSTGTNSSSP